jgi:hypothetical protein
VGMVIPVAASATRPLSVTVYDLPGVEMSGLPLSLISTGRVTMGGVGFIRGAIAEQPTRIRASRTRARLRGVSSVLLGSARRDVYPTHANHGLQVLHVCTSRPVCQAASTACWSVLNGPCHCPLSLPAPGRKPRPSLQCLHVERCTLALFTTQFS